MKLHSIEIIEERQVSAYFPDGCASRVQLHFQTDEGEQPVTGVLPGFPGHQSRKSPGFGPGSFLFFVLFSHQQVQGPENPFGIASSRHSGRVTGVVFGVSAKINTIT